MENLQDLLQKFQISEIGEANKQTLQNISKREKVYVFKLELVEEFNSIDECHKKYGDIMLESYRNGIPFNGLYISNDLNGNRKKKKTTKGSKIQVLLNGVEFAIYDSITEASSKLKIDRTCIQHTLSGKYKHYKGYTFEYKK